MKTCAEIRLENLERLRLECATWEEVAEKAGTSSIYLAQVRKRSLSQHGNARGIGDALARNIEHGFGRPIGWLDHEHRDDPLEEHLVDLYRRLSETFRERLIQDANHLLNLQHPVASPANPYPQLPIPRGS